jgi:predicted amidophosphoribosyltransferase
VSIFDELNELIFPNRCIACRALGISICSRCRVKWNLHRYITEISDQGDKKLKVVSSVRYSTIAQRVILAAKESHVKQADVLIADAIEHSIEYVLQRDWIDFLIPIPSRPSAVRKRGRQFIEEITNLAAMKFQLPVLPILHHGKRVKDQSGLSMEERRNNLAGAFVVKAEERARGRALLIDDLVTTGATLNEAAHTLRYAGIEVIGAVTAAVTLTTKIQ